MLQQHLITPMTLDNVLYKTHSLKTHSDRKGTDRHPACSKHKFVYATRMCTLINVRIRDSKCSSKYSNACFVLLCVGIHVSQFLFRAQTAAEFGPLVKRPSLFPVTLSRSQSAAKNRKCQKLSGGQCFELQFCLHHRGEQTSDRLCITRQKRSHLNYLTLLWPRKVNWTLCCFKAASCLRFLD